MLLIKGLSDVYDSRTVSRDRKTVMKDVNWEDILKNCNYELAPRALEMCRKLKEGDPRRKRFPSLISKFGRFEAITLYLLRDKIRIAINGATEEDIIYFNEKFSTSVEITSWRDGLSLHITSEEQFMEFCALDDRLNY